MVNSTHVDDIGISGPGAIQVPDVIPVFPLPETVLLPGEVLPLHIFEARYRDMVRDALASHRVIGLVESLVGDPAEGFTSGAIRDVGCVGLIAQHEEMDDGRFLLWLLGLERFHIEEELAAETRYRQVRVSYTPIVESVGQLAGIQPLRHELRRLLPKLIDADGTAEEMLTAQMEDVGDSQLIALACQILELGSERKQQILEAPTQVERFLMVYEDVYRHLELYPDLEVVEPGQLN